MTYGVVNWLENSCALCWKQRKVLETWIVYAQVS